MREHVTLNLTYQKELYTTWTSRVGTQIKMKTFELLKIPKAIFSEFLYLTKAEPPNTQLPLTLLGGSFP